MIVHAFSSASAPLGVRNSVNLVTLEPLVISAVTVPPVSAAIVFASATLKVVPETVTFWSVKASAPLPISVK